VVLLIILVLALAAPVLIKAVKSDHEIETKFNFPRQLSETELTAPPKIQKPYRYTLIMTDQEKRGKDINWSFILEKGPYDVVIIGDSFLGSGAGIYLCRKISADNNVSVLHISTNYIDYAAEPFQMLVVLTNSGFLKKTRARVIILENAERTLPGWIIQVGNLTRSDPPPGLISGEYNTSPLKSGNAQLLNGSIPNAAQPMNSSVLTTINKSLETIDDFFGEESRDMITLKTWIKNDIFSLVGSKSNDETLYFVRMNESRFTNPLYASQLIFYHDDIDFFHRPDSVYPEDYLMMNDNLKTMSKKLQNQNISLIFLPAISAYNTYYPYIIDPPTVRNPLFEIMRELNRSYILVDTKTVADGLQQKGEKDLSGVGDPAHWTWRMTEAVSDEINLSAKSITLPDIPDRDRQEEYNQAVQAFRAVIYERGNSDDPWAFKIDGAIYERSNDTRNATRCYLRSLQLDPHQPDIIVKLQKLMKNITISEN
jgi:tetratricopeptide (TPR) repeat protein